MRGCVSKRGNKFCYVVEIGKNAEGKRRQQSKSGFTKKEDAEKALTQVLHDLGMGTHIKPTTEKLGSFFLEVWLPHKKQHIRPGSYKYYYWNITGYIVPRLGNIGLDKLTPQHLVSLYNDLQYGERKLAPQTIKHLHKVLNDGMETACKWGMINKNVVKLVKPPSVPRGEMKVWTEGQLVQFLDLVKPIRYYIYFMLAATTGMRRGEVLGLRWEDIDLDEAKLTVRRSLSRGYQGYIIQEPKTTAGIRTVALPKQTVVALRQHKVQQAKEKLAAGPDYEDAGFVAMTMFGTLMKPQQLEEAWYKALVQSGLPKIRFHDLRHTHASLLLRRGVHVKIVSERLGHSNITITLNTYSHLLPGMQEEAATKMDELLNNAATDSPTIQHL
jgi:integrase